MDSLKIYDTCLNELKSIENRMAFDQVVLNLNKMDGKTRADIVNALSSVIARRKQAVIDTIQGVR